MEDLKQGSRQWAANICSVRIRPSFMIEDTVHHGMKWSSAQSPSQPSLDPLLQAPGKSIDNPVATHTVRLDLAQRKREQSDSSALSSCAALTLS